MLVRSTPVQSRSMLGLVRNMLELVRNMLELVHSTMAPGCMDRSRRPYA